MSANLNIVRERVNIFNGALAQGAPVVKIPEHSYKKPKRNYRPYGGSRELWNSTEPRVVIHGPAETGKAQPLDSIVYTPSGPRLMGELTVGDWVCTPDGSRARIIGIFPQGKRPIYRMTFREGDSVECDEDHLWLTGQYVQRNKRMGNHYEVKTTKTIKERGFTPSGHRKFFLPRTRPVDFNESEVPLDPYLVGVLLGDGCLRGGAGFSSADPEIVEGVRRAVYPDCSLKPDGLYGYRIVASDHLRPTGPRAYNSYFLDAVTLKLVHGCKVWLGLKKLDLADKLSRDKYVPDAYLYNSVANRLAVLQGLMDTDGTVDSVTGSPSFSSASLRLAKNVQFLVQSLGGIARLITQYYKGDYYHTVHIRWEKCSQLFRLTRKKQLTKIQTRGIHRKIASIEYVGEKYAQCITIDHPDHLYLTDYFAVTHNSVGVLHLLDHLCWSYPGLQAALVRKVAADMPASVIQSYERKVLKMEEGRNKTEDGISKYGGEHPEFYRYPNGSRVWVAGLDRPGKVLSSEKDVIVVNQAEELTQDDWETLSTRTTGRAGVLKPARLIGDCNPGPSTHWIPALASQGSLRMIQSNHRDNPTLFDPKTGEITEQGKISISSLEALTGVRRKRLLEGKWVAAEGIVYESFDKNIHMRASPIQDIQYHIAGVDWGLKNPGVIGVWGVDGDGRMYRVWEVYRTQKLVAASQPEDAWWINVAIELRNFFKIRKFVCDPSRPDHISAFQKAGLPAIGAFNDKSLGIQNIESRLAIQPDGFPRLFLLYNSKAAPDPLLLKEHKPTCLEEEIEVYSWQKDAAGKPIKEEPVDDNNHACDETRYVAAEVDGLGPDRRLIYA